MLGPADNLIIYCQAALDFQSRVSFSLLFFTLVSTLKMLPSSLMSGL
jgi:hypothetical protein